MKRQIKITTGCKTYGHITFDTARPESLLGICDDPECGSCRRLSAAIKAEVDKFKLKPMDENVKAFFSGNTPEEIKEFKDRLYELDFKLVFGMDYKPRMVDPVHFPHEFTGSPVHMTVDEIIESGKFDFLTIGELKSMRAVVGRSENENPEADFENMVKFLLDTGRLKIYQYAEILQLDTLKEKVDALNKMMLDE